VRTLDGRHSGRGAVAATVSVCPASGRRAEYQNSASHAAWPACQPSPTPGHGRAARSAGSGMGQPERLTDPGPAPDSHHWPPLQNYRADDARVAPARLAPASCSSATQFPCTTKITPTAHDSRSKPGHHSLQSVIASGASRGRLGGEGAPVGDLLRELGRCLPAGPLGLCPECGEPVDH
jgi:hypothetical protein